MDDRKPVSIYHLIIAAIVLLAVLALAARLNKATEPTVKPPAGNTTAPAGEVERPYYIPPINPFPEYEETKKAIEEQMKRQESLKKKVADRDKRADIVRAEVIIAQDKLLADEVSNAQKKDAASTKSISTIKYVKKGLSNETKQTILSGGCHVGH